MVRPLIRVTLPYLLVLLGLAIPSVFTAQQVTIEPRQKARPKAAETGPDAPSRPDIRVDTNMVLVPVAVSDAFGRNVSGLEKDDFKVTDNQAKQTILTFAREDDPVALGFVFDTSGSMGDVLRESRSAANEFFKTANPEDEFFLVEFDSRPRLVVPLTKDAAKISYELLYSKSKGSTALIDAVYMALNEIRKSKLTRKALIVISDGGDNNSRYTQKELDNLVRESDTMIYTIGILGRDYDGGFLKRIAEGTGGRLFPADRNLADIAQKIVIDLRNLYVLGYSPTNYARDGKYHRIQVQVVQPRGLPKLTPHWRQGYYAPTE